METPDYRRLANGLVSYTGLCPADWQRSIRRCRILAHHAGEGKRSSTEYAIGSEESCEKPTATLDQTEAEKHCGQLGGSHVPERQKELSVILCWNSWRKSLVLDRRRRKTGM